MLIAVYMAWYAVLLKKLNVIDLCHRSHNYTIFVPQSINRDALRLLIEWTWPLV